MLCINMRFWISFLNLWSTCILCHGDWIEMLLYVLLIISVDKQLQDSKCETELRVNPSLAVNPNFACISILYTVDNFTSEPYILCLLILPVLHGLWYLLDAYATWNVAINNEMGSLLKNSFNSFQNHHLCKTKILSDMTLTLSLTAAFQVWFGALKHRPVPPLFNSYMAQKMLINLTRLLLEKKNADKLD